MGRLNRGGDTKVMRLKAQPGHANQAFKLADVYSWVDE